MQNIISFMGLFCKKETYNFKEPTSRSHPVYIYVWSHSSHSKLSKGAQGEELGGGLRSRVTRSGSSHSSCIHIYWVATISRLLKIIGLFAEYRSLLQGSFAKETSRFKEPTSRSHSIYIYVWSQSSHCKLSKGAQARS